MSRKRRKKKNSKGTIIIAVVIVLIFVAGVVFLLGGGNGDADNLEITEKPEISTTLSESKNQSSETTEKEETSAQTTEEQTEKETEKKEDTTIPTAAPVQKVEADISEVIESVVSHYEDYMGMENGVLTVKEGEVVQRNGKYELILRSNAQSPNKYVCDIFIDIKTGDVTDSMGSEPWKIKM